MQESGSKDQLETLIYKMERYSVLQLKNEKFPCKCCTFQEID